MALKRRRDIARSRLENPRRCRNNEPAAVWQGACSHRTTRPYRRICACWVMGWPRPLAGGRSPPRISGGSIGLAVLVVPPV